MKQNLQAVIEDIVKDMELVISKIENVDGFFEVKAESSNTSLGRINLLLHASRSDVRMAIDMINRVTLNKE